MPPRTVRENVVWADNWPSLTLKVMRAVPETFCAGVKVTVRLEPLPPKRMFAWGRSVGLEEEPVRVSELADTAELPMINGRGPEEVLALSTRFESDEMKGGETELNKAAISDSARTRE